MSKLFIAVLNMSLAASWVALIVILLRLPLKKLPKRYIYILWMVVLVRLCIPFSFESAISLLAVRPQTIPSDIAIAAAPSVDSGLNLLDTAVNGAIRALPPSVPQASVNPLQAVISVGAIIWLAGAALMLCYAAVSFLRLKLRLSAAVRTAEDNASRVLESDRITSPFVLGFFRPKIYLPLGLSGHEREYILRHERAHLRRGDHIFKALWYIALCFHWFNPLAWMSFFLMGRDMEMACDEQVLRESDEDVRRLYSGSLLSLSVKRSGLLVPLAFGEHSIKTRIKNVLTYKKPVFWLSAAAVVIIVVSAICLLANPVTEKTTPQGHEEITPDADNLSATTAIDGFAIEKALADARFFIVPPPSTGEPVFEADLIAVGSAALQSFYSYFARLDVPAEYRILSFEPHGIALLAGTPEEFAVAMDFDYKTSGRYFMSANGSVVPTSDGGLEVTRAYVELRIKHLSGNTSYQIIDMGTGGAGQGLPPINEWLYRRELANANDKKPEILAALQAQFEAYRAGTVTNNLLEPRFAPMPDDALTPELKTVDDFALVSGNDMTPVFAIVDLGKYEAHCGIVHMETADGRSGEYVTSVSFQAKAPDPDQGPLYPETPATPLVTTIGPGWIGCSFAVLDGDLSDHDQLRSAVTGFTPLVLFPGDNPSVTERARILAENATINGKQPTAIDLWYYPDSDGEPQPVDVESYRLDPDRLEGEGLVFNTFLLPALPGDYLCSALLTFENGLQQTLVFAVRVIGLSQSLGQSYDGITGEKLSNTDLSARMTIGEDSTFRAGTRAELEEWLAKIANASNQTMTKLLVAIHYTETTRDLTPDEIALVLDTLKASNLGVFENLPNPATGGGIAIAAYDAQNNLQWAVSFDGSLWCAVYDGTENLVFNGGQAYLNRLAPALEP